MRRTGIALGIAGLLILLSACGHQQVPSFTATKHITRAEVTNNLGGGTGIASPANDNLNELLNTLHLGDVTDATPKDATAPPAPGFTAVLYDHDSVALKILIPQAATATAVYIQDEADSTHTGTYALKHALKAADLQRFIPKYPEPSN
jgi:hypothetical protein